MLPLLAPAPPYSIVVYCRRLVPGDQALNWTPPQSPGVFVAWLLVNSTGEVAVPCVFRVPLYPLQATCSHAPEVNRTSTPASTVSVDAVVTTVVSGMLIE